VSGDFRRHSVAYFITPILAQHNHDQFEIFCYDNNTVADEINQSLQRYADHWVNCSSLSDEELTNRIRQDQIDILVDLSGPTSKNRLLVFARRPAPIQVTYLGYPTTTGLTAIDYRITDKYVDVTGINDSWNAEVPIKLSTCFFCYQPYADSPPVNDLPMLQTGRVTFSSFNSLAKLSPEILILWARVLNAVPNSTLLIKTRHVSEPAVRQHLENRFAKFGIPPSQLRLEDRTPPPAYLQTYHQVDIALDSYPFNGGLTTCEALWMGIPVVTLVGNRHVSRMGLSILTTLGLTELIADTPEKYIQTCLKWVKEVEYLQTLRQELRRRMESSPLMDAVSFTANLEKVYQRICH
jgi:predicted O-linked N-acetylglucosamine transferase (SPINDLY family)